MSFYREMSPQLHMICGLPTSGKSTLAKKLEKETGAIRLTPDEWIDSIFNQNMEGKERDSIEDIQWQLAKRLLRQGCSVILESGFWSREQRKAVRQTAIDLGAQVQIHFLDVPVDELQKRAVERNKNLGQGVFFTDPRKIPDWAEFFEPLDQEEKEFLGPTITDKRINFKVRNYEESDFSKIVDVCHKAFESIHHSFKNVLGVAIYDCSFKDWKNKHREYLETICNDDSKTKIIVAEHSNEIVAFCAYSMNKDVLAGEIEMNAVLPSRQRNGISKRLYTAAIDEMVKDGMKVVSVATGGDTGHFPARRSYESLGFKPLPLVRYYKLL